MKEDENKASTTAHAERNALWPPIVRDILQGVTVAGVLAVGIWVGSIRTAVDQNKERLQEISKAVLDTKEGVSVRTAVLEEKLKGIDEKITALANQMKTTRSTSGAREYKNQGELRQIGGRRAQPDIQLSELVAELGVLWKSIEEIQGTVPEAYSQNVLGRLETLQQEIETLRHLK